jgi:hypothetical protein
MSAPGYRADFHYLKRTLVLPSLYHSKQARALRDSRRSARRWGYLPAKVFASKIPMLTEVFKEITPLWRVSAMSKLVMDDEKG